MDQFKPLDQLRKVRIIFVEKIAALEIRYMTAMKFSCRPIPDVVARISLTNKFPFAI
jgi:hypothetical protein